MRWIKQMMGTVLALACLAACNVSVTVPPVDHHQPTPITTGIPRFQSSVCPFTLGSNFVEGRNVLCGYLVVPEDRSDARSPTIQLAVAIFKTPSAHPAPDPMLFLQGGPGGRIIKDFAGLITGGSIDLVSQFGNHDLILIDQRGTGFSQPSLQCQEVVDLQFQTDVNLTPAQQVDANYTALSACRARLVKAGVNLSAYTTASDAADVHDLIHVLGYPQVDLYGVSYGTRLALEVMRAFPQGIRSVVLDSTVPAQQRLLTSLPSSTARVFGVLFQGCAADATCNSKYPQLDAVFYSLVGALNASPIQFDTQDANTGQHYTVLFKGDDLVNLLFTAFYVTDAIPLLPQMIYQVKHGDYTHLLTLLYGTLIFDDSVSWGVYYSVECAEDVAYVAPQDVTAAAQAYPAQIRTDQLIGLQGEVSDCQLWNVRRADPSEGKPVASAIPTVVLEAEYDPVTPPSNGALAARTLSHSYSFLFPGLGHGAFLFSTCPTAVVLAFENDPTQKPDASCIATMGEPQFR
jgi:pimeloyl-ACP methyl ester carboxylesterase